MNNRGCNKNITMARNEGGKSNLDAGHSFVHIVKPITAHDTTYFEENQSQDHHGNNGSFHKSFSEAEPIIVRVNDKDVMLNKIMSPVAKI